jgi:small subunit ribosomal protein S17
MASTVASAAQRTLNAVVVSAGLMQKTVKVRIGTQQWNNHIRKVCSPLPFPPLSFYHLAVYFNWTNLLSSAQKYNRTTHLLVHDPRDSLRAGDIITIQPGWRASKHVHHVVSSIIAPFGTTVEERPPVPSAEEREAERDKKKAAKDERRRSRRNGSVDGESVLANGADEVPTA